MMRASVLSVTSVLAAALVAACISSDPAAGPEPQPAFPSRAEWTEDHLSVRVPVDVTLIGFTPAVVERVRDALGDHKVEHRVYNFDRVFPPVAGGQPVDPFVLAPVQPTAVYRVHEGAPLLAELKAALPSFEVAPGLYDARAVEDWLAANLPPDRLHPDHPGVVFLHFGDDRHAYRLQYVTGYIEPVRLFGERHPLIVLDVSAGVDPWVGVGAAGGFLYTDVLENDSEEVASALVDATRHMTEFRILQGPLYPQSTKPCHAVTLLVAARATTLSQVLPGYSSADDLLDVPQLTAAWESLLGEGRVHVDARVLLLPVDDAALDAVLRARDLSLLRTWLGMNWQTYWTPHDGCEAYVSLFLIGDVTDAGVSGIAMYDVTDDRRISLSSMNDLTQFREEDGVVGTVFYVDDPSRNRTDWVNFLFTHETGHLFGQRHPHDITTLDGGDGNFAFSSIWSAMSYEQDGKVPRFGAMDEANYWRNRAGFLLRDASGAGLEGGPAWQAAMDLLGRHAWQQAGDTLLAALQP
jgi:hypothetical protein